MGKMRDDGGGKVELDLVGRLIAVCGDYAHEWQMRRDKGNR